jgi:hypothetical protein
MGVRFPTAAQGGAPFFNIPASGAETVIITSPALTPPIDSAQILIFSSITMTVGTGGTNMVFRMRRGATGSGANFTTMQQVVTAGTQMTFTMFYVDTPGVVTGQQYSITASLTGATGGSTTNDASILLLAL